MKYIHNDEYYIKIVQNPKKSLKWQKTFSSIMKQKKTKIIRSPKYAKLNRIQVVQENETVGQKRLVSIIQLILGLNIKLFLAV